MLEAVRDAKKEGFAEAILVGDKDRLVEISNELKMNLSEFKFINTKMQATIDDAMLSKMNDRGQIKGCIIDVPLAIDNALSVEAAKTKKIDGEVAGNVMYKTLGFTTDSVSGGILVGTSAPVILTSRADSHQTKMNSIAFAVH